MNGRHFWFEKVLHPQSKQKLGPLYLITISMQRLKASLYSENALDLRLCPLSTYILLDPSITEISVDRIVFSKC